MKIAVNTRLLRRERISGIELFTFESMSRIAASHPEHTFYYIFDRKYDQSFITSDNIVPVVAGFKSHYRPVLLKIWFEIILPAILKKIKPDIFIAPDSMMSLSANVQTLLVIHDLGFEHFPEHLPAGISAFYRNHMPQYAQKAKRIATVSEFTRDDIVNRYYIDSAKIDIVYNGVGKQFIPMSEEVQQKIRSKYCNGSRFFLFVGTIHPRKNLAMQLQAFDTFRKNNSSFLHKFVIVGDRWIWDDTLDKVYSGMQYKNDVIFLGRLQPSELSEVFAAADALMYVSLFEGFGIPILEGFSAQIPVITSNVSSMPEIAGNAALCVSPTNTDEIADAMLSVVAQPTLRSTLIQNGIYQLSRFNWDKTANLLWNSVQKCLD